MADSPYPNFPEGYRFVGSWHGKHVCEERNPDGTLRFGVKPVPFHEATQNEIAEFYFDSNPQVTHAQSWPVIEKWYNDQGWYLRPKTW